MYQPLPASSSTATWVPFGAWTKVDELVLASLRMRRESAVTVALPMEANATPVHMDRTIPAAATVLTAFALKFIGMTPILDFHW